jgi:hypothetical protein
LSTTPFRQQSLGQFAEVFVVVRLSDLGPFRLLLRRKQFGVQGNSGRAEESPDSTFLTHSGHPRLSNCTATNVAMGLSEHLVGYR